MNNPNGFKPAFPQQHQEWVNGQQIDYYLVPGLTKREYFAAIAMQGLLADPSLAYPTDVDIWEKVASYSVKYADALLAALNEEAAES